MQEFKMINITDLLTQAFANLISGLITNIVWIVLFIWGFKMLVREIKEGVKKIPLWLEQYDNIKMKHYQIERARGIR